MLSRLAIVPAALIVTALGIIPARRIPQSDTRAAMLVTPRWLQEHMSDPKLVLLHVGDKAEYDTAHLAGARFITMNDVAAPRDTTPRARVLEMLPDSALRAQLAKFGISNDSRIVVYFGKDFVSPATRIVLTLDRAGLGDATSLLDGGMPAWVAEGFATTRDATAPREGKLSALKVKPNTVTGEWVRDNATKSGYALIDARAAAFYDGVNQGGPQTARKTGHIPGAVSVPYTSVWAANNTLKSPEELKEIFTKAGVKPGDTVVGYCHIGQQATAMLFAARSLGFKTVLYDGSFEDWAYRDWPVETPKR
jgi:thiosulfate/3-mercaptopyruvate sulfurtransferase